MVAGSLRAPQPSVGPGPGIQGWGSLRRDSHPESCLRISPGLRMPWRFGNQASRNTPVCRTQEHTLWRTLLEFVVGRNTFPLAGVIAFVINIRRSSLPLSRCSFSMPIFAPNGTVESVAASALLAVSIQNAVRSLAPSPLPPSPVHPLLRCLRPMSPTLSTTGITRDEVYEA